MGVISHYQDGMEGRYDHANHIRYCFYGVAMRWIFNPIMSVDLRIFPDQPMMYQLIAQAIVFIA